jgi:hypothetical protein
MTAEEFYVKREELIQEQKDNQGKRGYGLTAVQTRIANLLGFTDDNCKGYWGLPEHMHECPIDKPYVRQSFVYAVKCPAGLWSPAIEIKYGKTWDQNKAFDFALDSRFSWPTQPAKNILSTVWDVVVFDSEEEAFSAAINKAEAWLQEEDAKMTMLMRQFAFNELPERCPLDIYAITGAIESIEEIIEWLDAVEVVISGKPLPQDEDGQLKLAGEDLMPTEDGILSKDKNHATIAQRYQDYMFRLMDEQRELKEIKDEALAPHKEEIDAKKASIELWTFITNYYQVVKAMEEARVKSENADLTFCAYAYTIAGIKGVYVEVGTKQDMRNRECGIASDHTLEVIAEYLHGELVSNEEKKEPEETRNDN